MAYLLRRIRQNTIRKNMYRYLFMVIGAAVFLDLFSVAFHSLNVGQYEIAMAQVQSLNQFYVSLEEANHNLSSYVRSGENELFQGFCSAVEEAKQCLEGLGEHAVSQAFVRDVQDVREMLYSYAEISAGIKAQYIENRKEEFTSKLLAQMLQSYEQSQEIFEQIDQEFKNLHVSLLGFASERMQILRQKKLRYQIEFAAAILLLTVLSIAKGRRLADKIADPIQKLTEAAAEIRDGDMAQYTAVDIPEADSQELSVLIAVFNKMLDKIQEQFRATTEAAEAKAELHVKELENLKITNQLRSSELKVLQMQMNPHFLFNTLNMIAKTAYLGDVQETVFLLQKTAELLRYSLDYMGKSVTLARELEILDCYICLQEKRFGDRIEFEFDLDERFHHIQIPCLILQPLVENAVSHGVGMYQSGGRILIRTRYQESEGMGILSVIDNGVGLESEKLEQERKRLGEGWNAEEGIGLGNVYMRLENVFHDEMKIELYSEPGQETEVRILLPVKEEETEHVSGDYCR